MSLDAMSRPIAAISAAGGHLAILAASIDVGAIAFGITGIGAATVGLYVLAIRQINAAKIEAKRAWDEANKDTLSAQNVRLMDQVKTLQEATAAASKEMQESLQKARDSLHLLRNEANAERLRLTEEIARLTDELHSTRQELNAMRVEYRRLLEVVRVTNVRVTDNTDRIETLEQVGSSSGVQPVVAPEPEGSPDAR